MSQNTIQGAEWDSCLDGFTSHTEDWLEFVHGTTIQNFDAKAGILAIGGGDYGKGFYVFAACGEHSNWGQDTAAQWARIKAEAVADEHLTPCRVYVRIQKIDFAELKTRSFNSSNCKEAFDSYGKYGETEYDLIYGPTATKRKGPKTQEHKFPCQFKFENSTVGKLTIERIEPI